MANEQNLIRNEDLTPSQRRENARKAAKASVEARRKKKTIKEGIKAMMNEAAPDKVKAAFSRVGYEVDSNYEAVIAAIMMGAIKGNPRMMDKIIDMLGENEKDKARKAELKIARARLKIEQEREEREAEKQRVWVEAIKARETAQMEDDGFIDALKGTAAQDWSEDDDN